MMAKLTAAQKERIKELDAAIHSLAQVFIEPTGAPVKPLSSATMERLRTEIFEAFYQAGINGCYPCEIDSYLDEIPHKDKRITCAEMGENDCSLSKCPFCSEN